MAGVFFTGCSTLGPCHLCRRRGGLTDSQRQEVDLTPDRIHKKIVQLGANELSWAKAHSKDKSRIYLDDGSNPMSETDFDRLAASKTWAFSQSLVYASGGFPRDRLIVLGEDGEITEFPRWSSPYAKDLAT